MVSTTNGYFFTMKNDIYTVGALLQAWRQRRRLSQLTLANEANISQRHLSFVESGRSVPSREMILHLAERLEIPIRERNTLFIAAGFAPVYPSRTLDDPALEAARGALELILAGHEPNPVIAVDRQWTLVIANRAASILLEGVTPMLLEPPLNVLRASLHPEGLAPRIVNYGEWRAHVVSRLMHQVEVTADTQLAALLDEIRSFPAPPGNNSFNANHADSLLEIAIPLQLRTEHGTLSFISTTTVFGTAVDLTLSELTIESFLPADHFTSLYLREHCEPHNY
tara:strand:+ start:3180 stop:4025 length:846 start_codon:yes stop_codon:yes gene_type:complete